MPATAVKPSLAARAPESPERLTGAQRAAVLLIALGVEAASEVLPHLSDAEVEKISVQIARFKNVSSDLVEAVFVDYRDQALARDYVAQGGVSYARQVLEASLGGERAAEIMMKVEAAMEVSAFHLLQTVEIGQLTSFIEHEHPQTAALILSHLNPRKAADIVGRLPQERRTEVVYRLATMGQTSPELLRDIEAVIRQQIGSVFGSEVSHTGGVEKVAEILNGTSRTAERAIMEALRERDPELATAVKSLMFVFDDLLVLSGRDLQRVLMEVEQGDIVLALKGAPDALKAKILENVSERVAQTLEEELELLGPVRVRDVEDAQQRILEKAQELEEQEEITLAGGSDEQLV
ncbi:MAG: flagellar motor switch protein FliG [Rhodothermales bacterium]|nr:flagellar motor switch protein FliG [Rhodothermales bacterium]